MNSIALNIDCMEYMATLPDNHFDLAVVDPPYGIGISGQSGACNNERWKNPINKNYHCPKWDKKPPDSNYFIELKRVSKNWIVWGANYFTEIWPSRNMIIWDKKVSGNYSMFELAAVSINGTSKIFQYLWNGFKKQKPEFRIDPTQKPIALYQWIYKNYLPDGGKVIDTHLGSGSNRIAADKAGNIDFVGCELDKDYFEAQEKRWKEYKAQLNLFQ